MIWFESQMFANMVDSGYEYRGCSFRQHETVATLVVKVAHTNIPLVAFITARTTTECIWLFRKKWLDETVLFVPDRFA
jgi:hypothetical protein